MESKIKNLMSSFIDNVDRDLNPEVKYLTHTQQQKLRDKNIDWIMHAGTKKFQTDENWFNEMHSAGHRIINQTNQNITHTIKADVYCSSDGCVEKLLEIEQVSPPDGTSTVQVSITKLREYGYFRQNEHPPKLYCLDCIRKKLATS